MTTASTPSRSAQAFHWFRGDEALRRDPPRAATRRPAPARVEPARPRPTNCRPPSPSWSSVTAATLPRDVSGKWREAFERTELFGPLNDVSLPGTEQWLDADGVAERVASISFIAGLPDGERAALLDEVRALVAGDPAARLLPYVTDVHWCERRSSNWWERAAARSPVAANPRSVGDPRQRADAAADAGRHA